jgi:hypothetical protein
MHMIITRHNSSVFGEWLSSCFGFIRSFIS